MTTDPSAWLPRGSYDEARTMIGMTAGPIHGERRLSAVHAVED